MGARLILATRYTCSHPAHEDDFPSFPTWSALQAHVRAEHAPTCPHRECHGRTFKSAQRLKEHLKVHAEREIDLGTQVIDEDLPDVLLDGEGEISGKRKRRRKSEAAKEGGLKLRRIDSGSAGKEWVCEQEGCEKSFKTVSKTFLHTARILIPPKAPYTAVYDIL